MIKNYILKKKDYVVSVQVIPQLHHIKACPANIKLNHCITNVEATQNPKLNIASILLINKEKQTILFLFLHLILLCQIFKKFLMEASQFGIHQGNTHVVLN